MAVCNLPPKSTIKLTSFLNVGSRGCSFSKKKIARIEQIEGAEEIAALNLAYMGMI